MVDIYSTIRQYAIYPVKAVPASFPWGIGD
jgi:hypothetical protein